MKYELLYKEGDHSREVSLERSSAKGWGPEDHPIPALCFLSWLREGSVGQVSQGRARLCSFLFVFIFFLPPRPSQVLRNFEPTTSFTVEGLKPNTEYVFRLAARSALGLGAFTPEVRERTLQSSRCLSFSHPSLRGRQSGSQRWWAQGYGAVGQMVAVPRGFTRLGLLCGEVGGAGRLWDLAPSPQIVEMWWKSGAAACFVGLRRLAVSTWFGVAGSKGLTGGLSWPLVLSMLREDSGPAACGSVAVHQQTLSSSCLEGGHKQWSRETVGDLGGRGEGEGMNRTFSSFASLGGSSPRAGFP